MRIQFTLLFSLLYAGLFGQTIGYSDDLVHCEPLTMKTINQLSEAFQTNQLNSFDSIVNNWTKHCGISECTQRIIIIKNIKDHKPSDASILLYLENDFHTMFNDRYNSANKIDYGYIYEANKAYFGFVPLRHKIDSVLTEECKRLLLSDSLTTDEKIMCYIFSGDYESYKKLIKKTARHESVIKDYFLIKYREDRNAWLGYSLYTGIHIPVGSYNLFPASACFGPGVSSPFSKKLIFEFGFRYLLNSKNNNFYLNYNGDTSYVTTPDHLIVTGSVGYKIYETKKLTIMPKFAIGSEVLTTDIPHKINSSLDTTYFKFMPLHFAPGVTAFIPIFRKCYLGFSVNYHFCPFNWYDKLISEINTSAFSAEISFKF